MCEEKLPGGISLPPSHPDLARAGCACVCRFWARAHRRTCAPDPSPEKLTWFLLSDFSVVRGGEEALLPVRVRSTLDSSAPPLVPVMNASRCRNRWVEAAREGNGVCLYAFMLDLLEEFSTAYSCGRKCHFIQLAAHETVSSYFVDSRLATHT